MKLIKIGSVIIFHGGQREFSDWWWEDDGTGPIDFDDVVEIARENGTLTDYQSSKPKANENG